MEEAIAQNRTLFFLRMRPLGSYATARDQTDRAIPQTTIPRTSWMGIPVQDRNASGLGHLSGRNGAPGTTSPATRPKTPK